MILCLSEDPNATGSKNCDNPEFIGDGTCQIRNNNLRCDFDGGDCCAVSKVKFEKWCSLTSDCSCHEELTTSTTTKITLTSTAQFIPSGLDDTFIPPGQQANH